MITMNWGSYTLKNKIQLLESYIEAFDNPVMHRLNFRGKYLGSKVTGEQLESIRNNTFKDLYVGDYWIINSITWRIVDINYWLNCYKGNTDDEQTIAVTDPHLVIMPDSILYSSRMNPENSTSTGYFYSEMRTQNLDQAKEMINSAFLGLVLTRKEYLSAGCTNGHTSSGGWVDSDIELPNEVMIYGGHIFAASGDGTFVPYLYTTSKTQLSLMQMHPEFINYVKKSYWLRDVTYSVDFCAVSSLGSAHSYPASHQYGVRPVFAIH